MMQQVTPFCPVPLIFCAQTEDELNLVNCHLVVAADEAGFPLKKKKKTKLIESIYS